MPDWNALYRQKNTDMAEAAEVLLENSRLLPATGKVLDYACGLAGNGFFLAEKGYNVTAWDLSAVAVEKINVKAKEKKLIIHAEIKDLEKAPADVSEAFDIIVVSYFLHRETLRNLYHYLKKDGLLFYQTFSGPQLNGVGPSRDDFRLHRGELLQVFSDMQLLYYREDNYREDNYKEDNNHPEYKPDQVYFVAMK